MSMDTHTRLNEALAGRYAVERELGAGGMATVYLTRDLRHDRHVALKVLHPALADAIGAERFLHEIRVTARLEHPHILPLIDSGEVPSANDDGPPLLYYVMPYVEGESLRGRLTRERRLPLNEAVRLAAQVADALGYAHDRGIVHRDVKPENVLLSGEHVKVADFGIARATQAQTGALAFTATGVVVGTPAYMSPEQILGEREIDGRSDLYSLACMVFEMIAGAPPFAGATAGAQIARRLVEDAPRITSVLPDVPPMIDMLIARALSARPDERHATTREFGKALLVEISGTSPAVASRDQAAPTQSGRTRFVGREKELADLRARVANLSRGVGGVVLIGGEPGVGKTRLAETAMHEARAARALCLTGHCYEMEGSAAPYTPFTEILEFSARVMPPRTLRETMGDAAPELARIFPALRQAFPDIPAPMEMPPEQQRQYFFARYREFNERASRVAPIVALLDDLHWADEASLLLLSHLATYVDSIPILVIGTYRDVDLEVNRPFARTLEDLTRHRRAHRITLRRLPQDGTADLLAALGGAPPPPELVALLHHETEGNPFFVEEVFRHLSEEGRLFDVEGRWRTDLRAEALDVPEGVRLVIGRRLERLSADARAVLMSAAIIGPRFSARVLAALGEIEGDRLLDALDEALRARLIDEAATGRDTTYAFAHELIRQTLVTALSLPRRQRRHLKVADALEQTYGERIDQRAADMAYHLYYAGAAADAGRTCRFLVLAAEQAIARVAFQEALLHCDRGLEAADELAPLDRARLLRARGLALCGQGRWPDAEAPWFEAASLFESAGEYEEAAASCLDLQYLKGWGGANQAMCDLAARGLRLCGDRQSALWVRLLASQAHALVTTGEHERGEAAFREAHAADVVTGNRLLGAEVTAWEVLACHQQGRFTREIELARPTAELFRAHNERWRLSTFLDHVGLAMYFAGRFEEAETIGAELAPLAFELGSVGAAAMNEVSAASIALARTGDLREWAEAALRIRVAFARTGGPWIHMATRYQAMGHFLEGRWDAAADLTRQAEAEWPLGNQWDGWIFACRTVVQSYCDPPVALELFRQHRHIRPWPRTPALVGARCWAVLVIEPLVLLGELDEAAALYPVVRDAIEDGFVVHHLGLVQCAAGLAAAAGADWDHAESHFATALHQAHTLPHRIAQPEVRRWHAWMLSRRNAPGDRERAAVLLAEALALYREIGMAGHARLAANALAELQSSQA
jgi:tRNA A-37 threonylcarbamoyl transferase component Bud32/tetratricopeptide (TPR) repeat protein